MADVRMPDGTVVRFPDDMPKEQIRAMIATKFPDAVPTTPTQATAPTRSAPAGGGLPGLLQSADDAVRLLTTGATLGFADKLAGFLGGQGTEAERARTQAARERVGPIAAAALEIGGAVAPFATVPRLAAAVPAGVQGLRGMLARTGLSAAEGAGYGGAAAVGHDTDVGQGMTIGALFGGVAEPLASAAGSLGSSVMGSIRGLVNPGREASRRVAYARAVDDTLPNQPRVGSAEAAVAGRAGQPVLNIDRGGEATRELARSSANTSPLAWSMLDSTLRNRAQGQVPRVVDVVRRLVGGNSSMANRDALRRAAAQTNTPAYRRAMSDPQAQSVWDGVLSDLTGAPEVQSAIRQAAAKGRSAAVMEGVPPIRNPFRMDQTGRMVPVQGVTPNLRFWDEVKKQLDAVGTREARTFARTLRDHLDTIVPSYGVARAGAARFFDAEDALEAGEQFATSSLRLGSDEAAAAIRKFTNPERQLFMEGFADALVKRVMAAGDNRNLVINSVFNSPAARERIVLALGQRRARELEAVLRVEELMDMARQAMGNSTTVRQLIAQGVVGGSAGGALTGDWTGVSGGVLASLMLRRGLQSVNQDVATRVAQMLTSPDPAVAQRGVAMLARSEALMDALRAATMAGGVTMVGAQAN